MKEKFFVLFVSLGMFPSLSMAETYCSGLTVVMAGGCYHHTITAYASYQGLLNTVTSACAEVQRQLEDKANAWAKENCVDGERYMVSQKFNNLQEGERERNLFCATRETTSMADGDIAIRCTRGFRLIPAPTDRVWGETLPVPDLPLRLRFAQQKAQECMRIQNSARDFRITWQNTRPQMAIVDARGDVTHRAEVIGQCTQDLERPAMRAAVDSHRFNAESALRNCHFIFRSYGGLNLDCECQNGACQLHEQAFGVVAGRAPPSAVETEGADAHR